MRWAFLYSRERRDVENFLFSSFLYPIFFHLVLYDAAGYT